MLAVTDDDLFTGRSKGGIARRNALTTDERKAIAKKAALARWGAKATHRGNFKEQLGIDVECYVLDDDKKTAVISQIGMAKALGLSSRGNALPRFLANKVMSEAVGAELRSKIENPLKFQWGVGGAGTLPPVTVHGFDSSLLIDICNAIVAVETKLGDRYSGVAKQAHLILGASAKLGIRDLVYAFAGYSPSTEETIAAFKLYVIEEAREYEKEFPAELYREWYRLYRLPEPERNKPWKFKHLTVNQVYYPLAHSNGRILELTRAQRAKSTERRKRLHQFLSVIGVKALRQHLGQLLGIAQISSDQAEYERHVTKVFGRQQEMDL
jgi:P63C domain-containing protein